MKNEDVVRCESIFNIVHINEFSSYFANCTSLYIAPINS